MPVITERETSVSSDNANFAFILSKSVIARPIFSAGTFNVKLKYGSRRTDSACIRPCLTARYVACLKSPPSVCLGCALPLTRVIVRSVRGDPVRTPTGAFSYRCVIMRRCQFLSSTSSEQSALYNIPLPFSPGSIMR